MGVSLHKKSNLWRVRIWKNGLEYSGGYFDAKDRAIEQYDRMRKMTDEELTKMYYNNKERARYAIRETHKKYLLKQKQTKGL